MGNGSRTVVAVLAAGEARRMGSLKQLCRIGAQTLVERACAVAGAAGPVLVVTGAAAPAVSERARAAGAETAFNPAWRQGQASSVRTAAAWARSHGFDALAIMPADMPLLTAGHVRNVVGALEPPAFSIAASRSEKGLVAPCAFAACMFDELQTLQGDRGAAALVRAYAADGCVAEVSFENQDMLLDVDTPEDLERVRGMLGGKGASCGNLR